jgi:trk system potassium uptake protein TrkA
MRIAFVGSSKLTIMTARYLLEHKHEVIIVESDKNVIDELSNELDCGFLHGDGSRPELLRELAPEQTDFLFCLTENDQSNIITGLVGRSLGFKNVVTKIENHEFEHICTELGLEHTIIPTRTISRFLIDMLSGKDILELSTMIKDEARFFTFIARDEDEQEISALKLPETAQVICYYREEKFILADKENRLKKGDEVVILTHSKNLPSLRERWT